MVESVDEKLNIVKKGVGVSCTICNTQFDTSLEKSVRNKHHFCCKEHYHQFLASSSNPNKGKKRNLSDEARKKMHDSALKNLQTKEAQQKSALSRIGLKLSDEHKQKIRENAPKGKDNKSWKGPDASYQAKHMWIYGINGKPMFCTDCGVTSEQRIIQWSNKDHLYLGNVEDYTGRCIPCHRIYDRQHGLVDHLNNKAERFFAKAGNIQKRDITMDGIIVEETNFALNSKAFQKII